MGEGAIRPTTFNASVEDVTYESDVIVSGNDSFNPFLEVWDNGYQNLSSQSVNVDGGDQEDLPVVLSVRIAIIVGVIVGLIVMAWGSYALHRKRVRDSKRQKYHKTVLL